ncbi:hypothetical protein RvY_04382 [Ramazzottius varieornatus]|uniref:Phosphoacetylglucosamine mutase n=1 Tax=Ramazzottius varieornatus TaxID=947166 RepID=A0A1D1UX65_RAMVA|nr:hypothetical protein RvY_04382 [Ramazzottius varieornatus]
MNFNKVKDKIKNGYPKGTDRSLSYGTAGFRGPANNLDWVMFRMGLLGALRSKHQHGKAIGAMITASHNPIDDNGIKLIDPNGEMLEVSWESAATDLVNAGDVDVVNVLKNIVAKFEIDFSIPAIVYLAQDTRPSSDMLSTAVRDGVEAVGASVKDFHLLTTPQLHHIVNAQNSALSNSEQVDAMSSSLTAADASEEGYYAKLSEAFLGLLALKGSSAEGVKDEYEAEIYVDGANGIGAMKLAGLRSRLIGLDAKPPIIRIFNDGKDGVLNENCGADYVKVLQKPPKGTPINGAVKYAAFDGDADRVVYFYFDQAGAFRLLDGDKIATLISSFFADLVRESGLSLKIGIVQTAYANGASTRYIEQELKVPVVCVPTGVKHLHHCAKQYDIGIYFEANGHGTVLFSSRADMLIQNILDGKFFSEPYLPLAPSQTEESHGHGRHRKNSHVGFKTDDKGDLLVEEVVVEKDQPECKVAESEDNMQVGDVPKDELALNTEAKVDRVEGFSIVPKDELALKHEAEKEEEDEAVPMPSVIPKDEVALKLERELDDAQKKRQSSLVHMVQSIHSHNVEFFDAEELTEKEKESRTLAAKKLQLASRVINQTVGDAMADLLLVEAVLSLRGMSIRQWDEFYQDLPSRQLKVKVADRNVIQTTDAERKCSTPNGLQQTIDSAVRRYQSGRAFVRPSGTEDVVRVYAEADTQENADKLAGEVASSVFQMAGGVGQPPARPSV